MDVDDNGLQDFAIGALFSDKVIILKTKQVVRIRPEVQLLTPSYVEPKNNCENKLRWRFFNEHVRSLYITSE